MAQSSTLNSRFQLVYEAGFKEDGTSIYKRKSYNVKVASTPDQVYQAAQAIASLCSLPLYTVERTDKHEIIA